MNDPRQSSRATATTTTTTVTQVLATAVTTAHCTLRSQTIMASCLVNWNNVMTWQHWLLFCWSETEIVKYQNVRQNSMQIIVLTSSFSVFVKFQEICQSFHYLQEILSTLWTFQAKYSWILKYHVFTTHWLHDIQLDHQMKMEQVTLFLVIIYPFLHQC